MLEKWLQTLESRKQKTIDRLVCGDEDAFKTALRRIEINYVTAKDWLRRIYNLGYKVNEDLTAIKGFYDKCKDYKNNYDKMFYHLSEMERTTIH